MLSNGTYQHLYQWYYPEPMLAVVPGKPVSTELLRVAIENPTSGSLLSMNTATRDALLREYGVSWKPSDTLKIKVGNTGEEFEIVVFDGLPDLFIIRCEREVSAWTQFYPLYTSGTVTVPLTGTVTGVSPTTTNAWPSGGTTWTFESATTTWDEP